MIIDYDAVCDTCKQVVHAGLISAGIPSFGYGRRDDDGRGKVAAWVFEHAEHGTGVRIECMDTALDRLSDDYERVEL